MKRVLPAAGFVVAAVLSVAPAVGQTSSPVLPACDYREQWVDSAPVSGSQLVGFVLAMASSTVKHDGLFVHVGGVDRVRGLCIQLRSHDLRYFAELRCGAPAHDGWYRVPLASARSRDVERFTPQQLAVLARDATSCALPPDGEPLTLIPAAWGASGSKWGVASFFLNSRQSEPRLLPASIQSTCVAAAVNGSLYDYRCDAALPSGSVEAALQFQHDQRVLRLAFRTRMP